MERNLTNSEELEEVVDKIFLLNHNLVSEMISSSQDEEVKKYPKLNQELENKAVEELSKYYAELRGKMRTALSLSDEIVLAEYAGLSSKTQEEIKRQEREEYKDRLIEAIESRLRTMFVSMNFVPVGITIEGETTEVPTFYQGKPEEFVRAQEFQTLMESIYKQIEIIDFEDEFAKRSTGPDGVISPYIVPALLDAIGDKAAYAKAEADCETYLEQSKSQEEVYDQFPELRDTAEQVEFLRIQNRYKRRFEEAAGYLNPKTTYGEYFFNLYEKGVLPLLTGFNNDEIKSRVNDRVSEYAERNKDIIHKMFESSVRKFKKFRRKRNIDEAMEYIKYRLSRASQLPQELMKKRQKPNKKMSENAKPVTADTKKGKKSKAKDSPKNKETSSKTTKKQISKDKDEK